MLPILRPETVLAVLVIPRSPISLVRLLQEFKLFVNLPCRAGPFQNWSFPLSVETSTHTTFPEGWSGVEPALRKPLIGRLAVGESVVAFMMSDVDRDQYYRKTLLVLTNRRLISQSTSNGGQEWSLTEVDKIRPKDRGGLGTLELLGKDQRLALWHYTLAQGPSALILSDRFEDLKENRAPSKVQDEDEIPEVEDYEPPPNTMALFRLWQFAKPHSRWMFLAFLLSITAATARYFTVDMTGNITTVLQEYVESKGQSSLLPTYGFLAIMLSAAAVDWLLGWGQGAILARVSERITGDLRKRTFSHLQKLSLEYFGGKRTGDLMSRISSDSDRLCAFLSDSIVDFSADSILLIIFGCGLFMINVKLAFLTLIPFPFIVWLMYYSRDKLQSGFQSSSRAWAGMTSVLADTIPGIRVVKAFAQEDREIERFNTANEIVITANSKVNALWTFFWPLIVFLNHVSLIVVWIGAVWLFGRHEPNFNLGSLVKFIGLSTIFYGKLEMMSRIVNASQKAAASTQRIFEILDRVSTVPEPARPVALDKLRGDLEFRHVGFRYGNRKVIRDFSLKIEAGEMIGLVGHTGAGKSTLINLVCRFFDVAEGAILADGVDIRSYKIEHYRRNVGIVLQDPFLFYGSIAENIAYGMPNATREQIIEAAKAARAHEFILQLADGYDSLVGERGQSLSGGERQRISIARALLIDPRILILDEATSALDSTTERQIQEALQNLVRGRTTIAIAHRLSTLRQANRIMVIERGRLIEIGTHEELLKIEGAYAALHKAQQELTKDIGW